VWLHRAEVGEPVTYCLGHTVDFCLECVILVQEKHAGGVLKGRVLDQVLKHVSAGDHLVARLS